MKTVIINRSGFFQMCVASKALKYRNVEVLCARASVCAQWNPREYRLTKNIYACPLGQNDLKVWRKCRIMYLVV